MRPSALRVAHRHLATVEGRFYMFVENLKKDWKFQYSSTFAWNDDSSSYVQVRDHSSYVRWKKMLSQGSLGSTDNYIYEIRGARLFDGSERDIYRLIKAGAIDPADAAQNHATTLPDDIAGQAKAISTLAKKIFSPRASTWGIVDFPLFKKLFDGWAWRDSYYIWKPYLLENSVLVDGAAERIDFSRADEGFVMPEWVVAELIRYTADPGKKMKAGVKTWLLENAPKPYTSKTVYRGYGTQLDDYGDFPPMKDIAKKLFRRTGVRDLTKLRVGGPIKVKRGKESSWSVSPQVAMNFATGMAIKSINWLVQLEVPADKIVVDFTVLPDHLRRQFRFHGQGEVIVDKGVYTGKISQTWVEDQFLRWLHTQGMNFVRQQGVVNR